MRGYYLTDEDFAEATANGISKQNAYNRYYILGWSRKRAVTQPLVRRTYDWEKWKEKSLVKRASFNKRISEGWAPEDAALVPPYHDRYKGSKITQEHYKIAEANGIGKNTVSMRVYTYKWSVEDAIKLPPGTTKSYKKLKYQALVKERVSK